MVHGSLGPYSFPLGAHLLLLAVLLFMCSPSVFAEKRRNKSRFFNEFNDPEDAVCCGWVPTKERRLVTIKGSWLTAVFRVVVFVNK